MDKVCSKCNGTGSYMYDDLHGKFCEDCCKHDKGWWLLKEHYGENNGKLCCLAGCGVVREPDQVILNGKDNQTP